MLSELLLYSNLKSTLGYETATWEVFFCVFFFPVWSSVVLSHWSVKLKDFHSGAIAETFRPERWVSRLVERCQSWDFWSRHTTEAGGWILVCYFYLQLWILIFHDVHTNWGSALLVWDCSFYPDIRGHEVLARCLRCLWWNNWSITHHISSMRGTDISNCDDIPWILHSFWDACNSWTYYHLKRLVGYFNPRKRELNHYCAQIDRGLNMLQ